MYSRDRAGCLRALGQSLAVVCCRPHLVTPVFQSSVRGWPATLAATVLTSADHRDRRDGPSAGAWNQESPLPTPAHGLSAFAASGRTFAAAGTASAAARRKSLLRSERRNRQATALPRRGLFQGPGRDLSAIRVHRRYQGPRTSDCSRSCQLPSRDAQVNLVQRPAATSILAAGAASPVPSWRGPGPPQQRAACGPGASWAACDEQRRSIVRPLKAMALGSER